MSKNIQEIRLKRSAELARFIEINELNDFSGFIIWLSARYEKGESSYDIADVLYRSGVNFSTRSIQRFISRIGISRDKSMALKASWKRRKT